MHHTTNKKAKAAGTGKDAKTAPGVTAQFKDMVLQALGESGGVEYLKEQARENPRAFFSLMGKIIPLQVSGPDGGPITITTPPAPLDVMRELAKRRENA